MPPIIHVSVVSLVNKNVFHAIFMNQLSLKVKNSNYLNNLNFNPFLMKCAKSNRFCNCNANEDHTMKHHYK